jgi:hypothetical protein
VTSTASPIDQEEPRTSRACMVLEKRPTVSILPAVTSALDRPSNVRVAGQRLSRCANTTRLRSDMFAIGPGDRAIFGTACARRGGSTSVNALLSSALGRTPLRPCRKLYVQIRCEVDPNHVSPSPIRKNSPELLELGRVFLVA